MRKRTLSNPVTDADRLTVVRLLAEREPIYGEVRQALARRVKQLVEDYGGGEQVAEMGTVFAGVTGSSLANAPSIRAGKALLTRTCRESRER